MRIYELMKKEGRAGVVGVAWGLVRGRRPSLCFALQNHGNFTGIPANYQEIVVYVGSLQSRGLLWGFLEALLRPSWSCVLLPLGSLVSLCCPLDAFLGPIQGIFWILPPLSLPLWEPFSIHFRRI